MAILTLTLLAQPNPTAVRAIVQDLTIPEVSVDDLSIATPMVESGDEMSVRVGVAGEAYANSQFPYFGAVTVTYHRLSMQDTFGPLNLELMVQFPTTTSYLIQLLGEALAIHFSEDDYVEELIELSSDLSQRSYVLRAGAQSPRWIGQTTIQLHRAE